VIGTRGLVTVYSRIRRRLDAEHSALCSLLPVVLSALQLFAALVPQPAAAFDAEESKLKAAYIYNFAKFTRWPRERLPDDNAVLFLCIVGAPQIERELQNVEGRSLGSHPVRLLVDMHALNAPSCHVVYLGESVLVAPESIERLISQGALVVSDAAFKGCIRFGKEGTRLSFSVDLRQARQAGISLSSDLLKLAKEVHGLEDSP
jgi:hypothetical protein